MSKTKTDDVVLLSGGNPQIPKGYGEEPIRAYIAAMPGWKSAVGQRIDDIITQTVPNVCKAVKWNSPMYGMERDVFFLSYHCMTKYIKIAFHRGSQLNPVPPVGSKQPETRYFHIEEGGFDESRFTDWVEQASKLPGVKM